MEEFTQMDMDTIAEIGNISLGTAATALSNILERRVTITAPKVYLTTFGEVTINYPIPCVLVEVRYLSGLVGSNIFILKESDAAIIASLMMGNMQVASTDSVGEIELSAIEEAMNQMMGFSATSLSELFACTIDISPPKLSRVDLAQNTGVFSHLGEPDEPCVQVIFRMEVEGLIDSNMLQLVPLNFARKMTGQLIVALEQKHSGPAQRQQEEEITNTDEVLPENILEEVISSEEQEIMRADRSKWMRLKNGKMVNFDLVKDIPVDITVILGRNRYLLRELYAKGPGSVIELLQFAQTPVEILANNRLVARGEIVIINGQFGVKITSMETPYAYRTAGA